MISMDGRCGRYFTHTFIKAKKNVESNMYWAPLVMEAGEDKKGKGREIYGKRSALNQDIYTM
ncbi:hypothetical protein GCM10023183_23700 [Nibribacter koreensis]|uniref:Uncharacterized protein n=1 Tax=Nibribacter koreensis TaxID=1084519 RepID=A0ABP8FN61_9BACT